jgi:transposase-like protein
MRADPVPAEEQYRLIMECRASGMTDYQWCTEHGIKPGTFYNWVKRLRKSGCTDIPAAVRHCRPDRQEIVQISFNKPAESLHSDLLLTSYFFTPKSRHLPSFIHLTA